ncbi:MAG: GFA family protein [Hyphomonadaceae bacterium JAD_PAG50586_4]|nr:MAG: GFA family protein [Hyphomonadaceae bacterium JAD_PAG50586_4]
MRLTLCYCRFCQRATGSTHMVEPIFQKSDFEVTDGEAAIYSLQSQGSGKQVHVHFCSRCGTKICLRFERFPDVVGVYAGAFDNPSWFDSTPETTACLFLDSAAAGAIVPAGVPVYRQHRSGPDGLPNEAIVFEAPHQVKLAE